MYVCPFFCSIFHNYNSNKYVSLLCLYIFWVCICTFTVIARIFLMKLLQQNEAEIPIKTLLINITLHLKSEKSEKLTFGIGI